MGGDSAASSALSKLALGVLLLLVEPSISSTESHSRVYKFLAPGEGGCQLPTVMTSCSDAQPQLPRSLSSSGCAVQRDFDCAL